MVPARDGVALEALVTRDDGVDASTAILERLTTAPGTTRGFLLRALNARAPESVLPAVLVRLDDTWNDPASLRALTTFVRARGEREAGASFGGLLDAVSLDRVDALTDRVATLRDVLPGRLVAELQRWRVRSEVVDFLATVGTVWRDAPADGTSWPTSWAGGSPRWRRITG